MFNKPENIFIGKINRKEKKLRNYFCKNFRWFRSFFCFIQMKNNVFQYFGWCKTFYNSLASGRDRNRLQFRLYVLCSLHRYVTKPKINCAIVVFQYFCWIRFLLSTLWRHRKWFYFCASFNFSSIKIDRVLFSLSFCLPLRYFQHFVCLCIHQTNASVAIANKCRKNGTRRYMRQVKA